MADSRMRSKALPGVAFLDARYRLVAFSLLILMAIMATLPSCAPAPAAADFPDLYERQVTGNVFDTAPVRGDLKPLVIHRAGFTYHCSECHTSLVPLAHQQEVIPVHNNVTLSHGLNTRCINCHHPKNRDVYVDHEGGEIPAEEPARLCSKCHGPTYREWELGIHGRQNGYWSAELGERKKLLCIQCHDPHNPAFKPMVPEPPPQRTRFASDSHEGEHP